MDEAPLTAIPFASAVYRPRSVLKRARQMEVPPSSIRTLASVAELAFADMFS
ncbi:MAG: hypothetical protein WCH39_24535 [Schlesneria sp.]